MYNKSMYRTILCMVSLICCVIGLIWSYFKCSKSKNDCILKNVTRAVAISQLLALTFNIVNLFIGTVAGKIKFYLFIVTLSGRIKVNLFIGTLYRINLFLGTLNDT